MYIDKNQPSYRDLWKMMLDDDLQHFKKIRPLLNTGRLNYPDSELIYSAVSVDAKEIAKYLLSNGAIPNWHAPLSLTHVCARFGYRELLKTLLQYGAPVDEVDSFGNTPLFLAMITHESECAIELLEHGADPYFTRESGESPVLLAAISEDDSVAKVIDAQWVQSRKCNANGKNALHALAARTSKIDLKYFQSIGYDLNAKDDFGNTLFHYACRTGNGHLFEDADELGINFLASNNLGETMMDVAVAANNTLAVLYLIMYLKIDPRVTYNGIDFATSLKWPEEEWENFNHICSELNLMDQENRSPSTLH